MIAIIIVGDEILAGDVQDENLPFMIKSLGAVGYRTSEARIVGDDVNVIAETFRELAARHDFVISSGGIGPTHDDVTMEGAAEGLGLPLRRHPVMAEFLKGHYGEPLPESVERMALLPEGAEVFIDYHHHWPLIRVQNCYVLPGLPVALRDKIGRIAEMLPRLDRIWAGRLYLNADETQLASWLSELQRRHPSTAIGSYPLFRASYSTRITVKCADRAECRATFDEARRYFDQHGWLVRVEEPEQAGPDGLPPQASGSEG
ncbi:MAG: competence/damage-inducible protein A [Spirochaetota bacterium]